MLAYVSVMKTGRMSDTGYHYIGAGSAWFFKKQAYFHICGYVKIFFTVTNAYRLPNEAFIWTK